MAFHTLFPTLFHTLGKGMEHYGVPPLPLKWHAATYMNEHIFLIIYLAKRYRVYDAQSWLPEAREGRPREASAGLEGPGAEAGRLGLRPRGRRRLTVIRPSLPWSSCLRWVSFPNYGRFFDPGSGVFVGLWLN